MARIIAALFALVALWAAPARAQSFPAWTVASCPATLGFAAGVWRNFAIDLGGNLCIAGTVTVTPSGTQDVNLTKVGGSAIAIGQALMAASLPVAIASNQSTLTVTGAGGTFPVTQSTSPWVVSNGGTFAVQAAITAASGSIASGAFASGSISSGAVASGAYASGAFASGAFSSGSFASGSQPVGITPTDHTITSATGSSQTVMNALATRKGLLIVNTGNANCGINPTGGTAVIGGAGTITLTPTGSYSPRIPTLAAVTAICTAGQPLYAEES